MSDDRVVRTTSAWRLEEGKLSPAEARVIVEEPLEIWVDGGLYAVVMRTPGDDRNLAAGFCLAEGLVDTAREIGGIAECELEDANRVTVLRSGARAAEPPPQHRARMAVASSCGLCGREIVDDLLARAPVIDRQVALTTGELLALGRRMQESQRHFRATGGTHAAALFGAAGEELAFGEDIGRHNALDKAIGRLLLAERLEEACVAVLSGRCSLEMVQKAVRAGLPVVASVSAPTSLAISLAERAGVTLVGFLRAQSLTVYADTGRIEGVSA